ncbi:MAG TPA: amidohydrolase family protein [Paracoccaceae bacterium]|nr:amidohydrolase family protein [Paracoccaceae bacterium]
MRIDAHQHYWHPARGDYGWMPKGDPLLDRPYGPAGLAPLLAAHGVDGTVLVQAAPSVEETEYMLGIADATPSVLGVVGWVDFERPEHRGHLERLRRHPKFLGVRPMIQDIPDPDWMLGAGLAWALDALADLDLTFDALGFPQHLQYFRILLKRHPRLRVVIDHCLKPRIRDHPAGFGAWCDGMRALAEETDAHVKLSGLVTEAAADWTPADLVPYAAHVLAIFGPERVMWGSDWPVCLLRAEYGRWLAAAEELTRDLGPEAQAAIFGRTASRFYRLAAASPG